MLITEAVAVYCERRAKYVECSMLARRKVVTFFSKWSMELPLFLKRLKREHKLRPRSANA
jgi:hypothetical protein